MGGLVKQLAAALTRDTTVRTYPCQTYVIDIYMLYYFRNINGSAKIKWKMAMILRIRLDCPILQRLRMLVYCHLCPTLLPSLPAYADHLQVSHVIY